MKHRLLTLTSTAVLLFSFGATLLSPATASAANGTETPTDLCTQQLNPTTATGGGQATQPASQAHIDACVKGVNAAIAKGAKAPSSVGDKSTPCYKTLYKNNTDLAGTCNVGYFYGYQYRDTINQPPATPGPGDKNPDAATQTACINDVWGGDAAAAKAANNGDLLKDCITGYQAQQSSKNENAACGASQVDPTQNNNIDYVYCTKGYDAATADSSNNNNDNPPDCESVNDGFNLSWAVCPIIEGLANAADGIYAEIIQPLLVTKPINLSNPQKDPSNVFAVWSNFRLYGNIFLVIALLVIVFGESIGGGMIDAYTAKKVLPRLLVAAVLINISIYLVAIAVDVTNIIGNGIATLMEAPFKEAACSTANNLTSTGHNCWALNLGGSTTDILGGLGIITLLVGTGGTIWALMSHGVTGTVAGIAKMGIIGPLVKFLLLFVLLPGFLTFVAIMITVLLRQGLILFLVFVSPVAFALYCLPNTEQYFRKWWDLLFRTLLIYPLIAIMFALANILSVTISSSTGGLSTIFGDILAITALFVPLFLIPFSFRIAGGVLGRFHEFATSTHKRGQEAIKGNVNDPQSLRNRTKRDLAAAAAERNLSGAGLIAQVPRFGDIRNPRGWNRQRRARLAAARNMYQARYGKEGTGYAMYEANSQDSNVTGDLAKYATGAESRAAIQKQYEQEINSGVDRQTADRNREQRLFSSAAADKIGRTPAMRRIALMNPATVGYEIDEGAQGWDQATSIMRDIAGNDEGTYRSMVNEFQYVAKTAAGRPDLSRATDGKPQKLNQAWGTGQIYGLGSVKPRAIESFGKEFLQQYQNASAGPIDEDAQKQIVDAGRFYLEQDAIIKGGATGAVRDAAQENIDKFRKAGIDRVLDTDAFHGTRTKEVQVRDPSTGKTSIKTVPFTMRDLAREGVRGYDREAERNAAAAGGGPTGTP